MTPTATGRPYGAARVYTDARLGGPTREAEQNVTLSTTISVLVESNPDRVGLVIVNQGANDVFVALQSNVSTSNGIRVSASGGSVSLDVRTDYTLPSRQWYGITAASTSDVYVLELISDIVSPSGG